MNAKTDDASALYAKRLSAAILETPPDVAVPLCAAVLDHYAGKMPAAENHFTNLREDCAFHASTATPHELREVVAAYCREIAERGPEKMAAIIPTGPRKLLLVAIWKSLPSEDQARFLQSVDPDGTFRRTGT